MSRSSAHVLRLGAKVGVVAAAIAILVTACDRADVDPGPGRLDPTAMAWLEPVGGTNVEGRFTLVGRVEGVQVTGRAEGLRPSAPHRLAIYDVEHCKQVGTGRPIDVLARLETDRAGRLDYLAMHPALGPVDDGEVGVAGRTLVIDSIDGDDGAATPVACGRVRFIGDLADSSDGRWQGIGR
jgi:hypothetical protein